MKVLFLKDVQGTAASGDVKEVTPGFARNYLFPRHLATHVTPRALEHVEKVRASSERRAQAAQDDAGKLAQQLGEAYVTLTVRAGEDGKLFGSITNQDVADALDLQYGITVDKRKISLTDTIRAVGSWVADVDLGHGITATVNLNVEAE
ncbi:MAG: large subunit ribosomal protein [Chloroflexota bacterium]|jgi:large subunit ribosomal protein L9|nr:large subunit ribosomal protein [Chloroflexota bacterium]